MGCVNVYFRKSEALKILTAIIVVVIFHKNCSRKRRMRNKRKTVKDKDKFKKIRKEAKKRWRAKKKLEKCFKTSQTAPKNSQKKNSPAVVVPPKPIEPVNQNAEQKSSVTVKVVSKSRVREIDPSLVVKTKTFLGSGSFGNCYLAFYRDLVVAVKEFKTGNSSCSVDALKKEAHHEARMISHIEDHAGVPLLFGVITKTMPVRLITKFHGHKDKSLTLRRAMRKMTLDKPTWLGIVKKVIIALEHIHTNGVLHNDLKENNVVLEKREEDWNPVIIDFGKACFTKHRKAVMTLSVAKQAEYKNKYPHIAPEIVCGSGRQSILSDIFSLGRVIAAVLKLIPTATALSVRMAKRDLCDDPSQRPALKEILAAL